MADDPIDADEMIAAYRAIARPRPAVRRSIAAALVRPAPDRRWTVATVVLAAAAAAVFVWRMRGAEVPTTVPAVRDVALYHDDTEASPRRATTRAPATPPAIAIEPTAPPVPPPRESTRASPPVKARARVELDRSAAAEIALLERVRADLHDGQLTDAIAGVERHAREFPRGVLGEERDALRVLVSCRLADRRAAALALRREFLRAHPRSTYSTRVRAACEETNTP